MGQAQHVRGAAHVLLHVPHVVAGLDVEAPGVEADALADQRDLGMLGIAPGDINQAWRFVAGPADGMNGGDRGSIDLEFQQLKAEINRIGDGTEYNGMKLINGQRAKNLSALGGLNEAILTDSTVEIGRAHV